MVYDTARDEHRGGHQMATFPEIIGMMRAVTPPGQDHLGESAARQLSELTYSLLAANEGVTQEYARFFAIRDRELCLPEDKIAARLQGATVLVTGGTGCIGSALMAQLAARCPGRLVSVSRGLTNAWARQVSAEYLYADVTNPLAMERLIGELRPDLIFHLAAQRDQGLAEVEVHRSVSTNVVGTRNVMAAVAEAGCPK